MRHYGWKSLTVSHHLVMFSSYWSSANVDIMYLICQVTLQDHMIEGSFDFISGCSSLYVPWAFR